MIDEKQITSTLPYSPVSVPTIGSMGRYVHKKGFHIYLEALAILKKKEIKFQAVLAGKGAEESALQEQAKNLNLNDILTFKPWISDKNKFYKNIDIFCLPSLHEPFGIILLEALLAGKACAVAESEGPSEIIKSQEHALTCPINDAKALAKILETLINNPKVAQKTAEKAREAAEPFLQEHVSKSIKDALSSICQSA
jgi:glycosyltransferase involved in cell wall biosynthesis